ncbi:MAG: histidinol phosphate phosphatase, partial [Lachnospiraceae bacterium]
HRKDPYLASFYEGRSETSAYLEYFESILENLSVFTDFDIYGHLDYVVRYGPHKNEQYSYLKYADILDAILHRLLDLGKGIELNTGGYRSGLGEPNPCIDVLKRYHELGGELITVGSDAHKPEAVCENFSQAASILHAAGFTYYCTFRSRTPSYHLL